MVADTVDPGSDDPFSCSGETFFKLDLAHVSVDMVGSTTAAKRRIYRIRLKSKLALSG
jgi:hypothetical protein